MKTKSEEKVNQLIKQLRTDLDILKIKLTTSVPYGHIDVSFVITKDGKIEDVKDIK